MPKLKIHRFLLGLILLGVLFQWNYIPRDFETLRSELLALELSPGLFMAVYTILALFLFPGSLLTLSAGFLFGPYWGALYSLISATLTAMISFHLMRWTQWRPQWMNAHPMVHQYIHHPKPWKILMVLRLVPLIPFNVLNYAFGWSNISGLQFLMVSFVAMIPGGMLYAFVGHTGKLSLLEPENMILYLALIALVIYVFYKVSRVFGNTVSTLFNTVRKG